MKNEKWLYLFNILVSRFVNSGKNIEKYIPASILCIKWDEIGDMATCTHVFSLLKKKFPKAKLVVITKPHSAPIIHGNPFIDEVYTDLKHWNKRYDLVVELRGTWRSLWRTFRYFPKIRLDRGLIRLKNRGNQAHETVTNFEIIKPVLQGLKFEHPQLFTNENNANNAEEFLLKNGIKKFAVLHVGARAVLRRWNAEKYARLADWLYSSRNLDVVFTGIKSEEHEIFEVSSLMNEPHYLFTDNSILDLAALLKRAEIFIGNESGPLQIADTVNIPVVGLFGPGVKDVFYPQSERSAVVHHILDCNPCDQLHCVRPNLTCMNLIELEEVQKAVEKVLNGIGMNN